jgi:WD40 repeat protein
MNDGRLVSGSVDSSIIIYNKISYNPDLIIREHKGCICCIIQLRSGILASCSRDKTIILFNIKGVNYEIVQTLKYHTDSIRKIIELKNKILVSCSKDSSIIFYKKDNLEYKKDYSISADGPISSVVQTTDNEICYSLSNKICFYNLLENKNKSITSSLSITDSFRLWLTMISKELLLVPGQNKMSIINVNKHSLIRVIEVPDSSYICGICLLKRNMLLTGDAQGVLRQWKIEKDNLTLISKKENAHDYWINVLLNLGDGHIASASNDCIITIW